MTPWMRLVAGAIGALLALALAWQTGLAGRAWRAAYPHLPAAVQGAPYRVRARLPGAARTPVPLPTPLPAAGTQPWGTVVVPGGNGQSNAQSVGNPDEGSAQGSGATRSATQRSDATTSVAAGTRTATGEQSTAEARRTGDVSPAPAASVAAGSSSPNPPTPAGASPPPPLPTLAAPPSAVLPAEASLDALRHSYQTWNNCGPATIDMALSAWGYAGDQALAATRLKPDPDDKNVAPHELARYARERGLGARVLVGGTLAQLRSLAAAGIPVILETWFVTDPDDQMGHYRLLSGYEDGGARLRFHDSYLGPNLVFDEDEVDRDWRVFNRLYVPVYPLDREADVRAIVGAAFDQPEAMWTIAAAAAQEEVRAAEAAGTADPYGYFNLGTSLVALGAHADAAAAFDRARAIGLPWRMLWYQHAIFEAYASQARWADVLALAEANLRNAPNLEESLLWRAAARDVAGDREAALADVRLALRVNPFLEAASAALAALESGASVADALRANAP